MTISRRGLMTMLAAMSTMPLLTSCETVTNGNTTTHTLNVAKIESYATAGLNAANTVASILALNPSFSVFVIPIRSVAEILGNSLVTFTNATGGKLEISYDDTNFKTLVDTLLDDLDKVLITIGGAVVSILKDNLGLETSLINKITLARDALATLVAVFKILVGGFISTASGSSPVMAESQALAVLNV